MLTYVSILVTEVVAFLQHFTKRKEQAKSRKGRVEIIQQFLAVFEEEITKIKKSGSPAEFVAKLGKYAESERNELKILTSN